jgi:hypothetical protein
MLRNDMLRGFSLVMVISKALAEAEPSTHRSTQVKLHGTSELRALPATHAQLPLMLSMLHCPPTTITSIDEPRALAFLIARQTPFAACTFTTVLLASG